MLKCLHLYADKGLNMTQRKLHGSFADIHMHHEYLYLNNQMEMLYSFLLKYLGWDLFL